MGSPGAVSRPFAGARCNATRVATDPKLVPLHLWSLDGVGKITNDTRHRVESGNSRTLFAFGEQHLHADTNAEERQATGDALVHEIFQPSGTYGRHACAKVPDTRQHGSMRIAYQHRIVGEPRICANFL